MIKCSNFKKKQKRIKKRKIYKHIYIRKRMKANKMITIDIDLIQKLKKEEVNVSEICNKALWRYIKKYEC